MERTGSLWGIILKKVKNILLPTLYEIMVNSHKLKKTCDHTFRVHYYKFINKFK